MGDSSSLLTALQEAVLVALKDVPDSFVTGGTVLARRLLHRRSLDVDLFVLNAEAVDIAERTLRTCVQEAGWTLEEMRRYPGFRRFRVFDGADQTMVDIVHEPVVQLVALADKPVKDGVRTDSWEDLVANKLCAVLGRSDVKDLVDLYFMAEGGTDVLSHLNGARRKDGGMEPATLAYVLEQMSTDPSALSLVRHVDAGALAAFRNSLVKRLLDEAWPESG